jgi:hypothetical protein
VRRSLLLILADNVYPLPSEVDPEATWPVSWLNLNVIREAERRAGAHRQPAYVMRLTPSHRLHQFRSPAPPHIASVLVEPGYRAGREARCC